MNADSAAEPSREELIALVAAQAGEIAALQARIAELERRLGLNSSNSSKPPSSDGLKKPVRVSSLREPSSKQTGGQKGHPGETLCRAETPDAIIDHYPSACAGCGAPLTGAMAIGHAARQVFDLPEPRPLHRGARVSMRGVRRTDACGVPRLGDGSGAVRQADRLAWLYWFTDHLCPGSGPPRRK